MEKRQIEDTKTRSGGYRGRYAPCAEQRFGIKDLGLLIIDEEQRFLECSIRSRLKKLKENIDVLTLTATPIPRTLHMSLIGIRDMSVLEEAPVDRMPIQTYVMEYNDEMVREAIQREIIPVTGTKCIMCITK